MPMKAVPSTPEDLEKRKARGGPELLSGIPFKNENDIHIVACNAYLRQGPTRKISHVVDAFSKKFHEDLGGTEINWQVVAKEFQWKERAIAFDAKIEQERNEAWTRVMTSGLSVDYNRVEALKGIAKVLIDQFHEQDEDGHHRWLWTKEIRRYGRMPHAVEYPIFTFNQGLVAQIRGVLDDLAKETGGRRETVDHNVTSEIALKTYVSVSPDDWDDEKKLPVETLDDDE